MGWKAAAWRAGHRCGERHPVGFRELLDGMRLEPSTEPHREGHPTPCWRAVGARRNAAVAFSDFGRGWDHPGPPGPIQRSRNRCFLAAHSASMALNRCCWSGLRS